MKIIFILLLSFSLQALAASVFVGEVKTSDGDQQLADSVKALISSSVSNAGDTQATDEASADFSLKANVIKLGPAIVLTVGKVRGGKVIYASRQKAGSISELDDATDRAVRAALVGVPAKKDMRVGEVKDADKEVIRNRVFTKNSVYAGFGPGYFVSMGTTQLSYNLALGYNWETGARTAIRALADGVFSGDFKTTFWDALIGLNLYLNDEDSSPFIFGGMGFGVSASTYSSATTIGALAGCIGLGYDLFRTSSTQFDIAVDYHNIFGNNTIGSPGFYALRLGMLF